MTATLPRTRIIPLSDFFSRLQMEYLCYRFRELIYQRPFDKKKFADICLKKKEKIDQIALENCLPTVFNNAVQRDVYLQKFFKKNGMPLFCYRDEYQQKVKGYYDAMYYYVIGTSVRFVENDSIEMGCVQECKVDEKKVVIEWEHHTVEHPFESVTRVFPSTFYLEFLGNSSV